MSDSDEEPQLSAHALAALQEFYKEQKEDAEKLEEALTSGDNNIQLKEDWQLSQFWYDDRTAEMLAKEALSAVGDTGRIACLSSPTAYKKLQELKPETVLVKCLEFDPRFQVFGEDFVMYDYKEPLKLDQTLKGAFDLVIADPPFLSEECLTKTAVTVKFLTAGKIILCTGAIMKDLAHRLLNVTKCKFEPSHSNGLQNEFACFSNYDAPVLNS
ncbi:EEF1A lysine methyltransferase 1 [Aplysia californica]|uniref:Protein-lysine N-methyltransferase LOC101861613 n=1 Tax=Aplysia californica TaxID=6500 RepID=A0ABM1A9L9_APLCA|nr:EEF1A lysine methyltransferase 1 [Aplysia californica]